VSCRISQIATIHAAFTPRLGVRPLGLFTFEGQDDRSLLVAFRDQLEEAVGGEEIKGEIAPSRRG
jgi:hypothetical protein